MVSLVGPGPPPKQDLEHLELKKQVYRHVLKGVPLVEIFDLHIVNFDGENRLTRVQSCLKNENFLLPSLVKIDKLRPICAQVVKVLQWKIDL